MASQITGVKQVTLGGDKNYDTQELVRDLREMKVTPHVAQNNTNRRSAIDGQPLSMRAMRSVRRNGSGSKRASAG